MSGGRVDAAAVVIGSFVVLFILFALVMGVGGPVRGLKPELVSLFDEQTRHVGDSLTARASLLDRGRPVEDADVSAVLIRPDDVHVPIPLKDDGRAPDSVRGDGVFSGVIPALSMPGRHSLIFHASRPRPDFLSETASASFSVARSRSYFNGQFEDRLEDGNGDGIVDFLRLGVGVAVSDSVRLQVNAFVTAGGRQLRGMQNKQVGAGNQMIGVGVWLDELVRTGYRGPFVVDSLVLSEDDGDNGMAVLESHPHPYTTAPYEIVADTLQDPYWTKRVTAHGVDRDGDGLYESLVVELGVAGLRLPGRYYCHAVLNRGWSYLAVGGEYLTLRSDSATVRLEFPGPCIAQTPSADGLRVTNLYLYYLESGRVSNKPHSSAHAENILLEQAFPAGAFETKGPQRFRSATGGIYECR